MIFLVRLVIIAIMCYALGPVMPWWIVSVCAFVVSFFLPGNNFNAFLSGFLGVGLLWMVMAWKFDMEAGSHMSNKIAQLFQLDDPMYLILGTGAIGAIVGGFSAFTGNSFRQIFIKKKKASLYS